MNEFIIFHWKLFLVTNLQAIYDLEIIAYAFVKALEV